MKDEALKLALGWYDSGNENRDEFIEMIKAITASKQALAAPAQEPVAWPKERDLFLRDDMGQGQLRVMFDGDNDVIVAIWPNGEPSASVEFCNGFNGGGKSPETRMALIALMCAMERDGAKTRPHDQITPPAAKRQWAGLTDEERDSLIREFNGLAVSFYKAIEAKLKEKNT